MKNTIICALVTTIPAAFFWCTAAYPCGEITVEQINIPAPPVKMVPKRERLPRLRNFAQYIGDELWTYIDVAPESSALHIYSTELNNLTQSTDFGLAKERLQELGLDMANAFRELRANAKAIELATKLSEFDKFVNFDFFPIRKSTFDLQTILTKTTRLLLRWQERKEINGFDLSIPHEANFLFVVGSLNDLIRALESIAEATREAQVTGIIKFRVELGPLQNQKRRILFLLENTPPANTQIFPLPETNGFGDYESRYPDLYWARKIIEAHGGTALHNKISKFDFTLGFAIPFTIGQPMDN